MNTEQLLKLEERDRLIKLALDLNIFGLNYPSTAKTEREKPREETIDLMTQEIKFEITKIDQDIKNA
jgi:hypothetical protein